MPRVRQWVSRTILAATVLGLIGGAAWLGLRPAQVTVVAIPIREIRPAIQGVGTVEAKVVVDLAAKFPSRVVSISVDEGDAVRKGQPLIQLDAAELRAAVESATAGLQRATLAVVAQEAAVLRAEAQLSGSDATLARARANQTMAQANAHRWRTLAATGVVAVMDLEARTTTAEVADQDVTSAAAQREATENCQ